jgi:hypothetical protein
MHINRNGRTALLAHLLIAVCACLSTSFAQQGTSVWVSFSAVKVSRVYQLSTSGRELIKETRQFTARSKDGSLFVYDAANYDPSSKNNHVGMLLDVATGKFFRIDYGHQRVQVLRTPGPDVSLTLRPTTGEDYKAAPPERSLGRKMINGVLCIGWKAVATGPNTMGGEMWVAPSLNYEPVEGVTLDETRHTLITMDLEEIQVGRGSDHPELFRIPEGFQMVE